MRLLLCLVVCFVLTAPAQAAWKEATSDNFIVYSDGLEAELVGFTQRVEKFDRLMRIMTGLNQPPAPVKVRIYLVGGDDEVRALEPHHRPQIAGFYTSLLDGGVAIVDRDRARSKFSLDGETVLYHEYSHHFMAQYSPIAYPAWYQEGFAEYYAATAINEDGTIEVGRLAMSRWPVLYTEPWLSPKQLMNDMPEDMPVKDLEHFYAQGWLLTHYLLNNPTRHAQFKQYLTLRAQGAQHAEALQKAFDLNDEQLGAELRTYFVRGKLPRQRVTAAGIAAPKVAIRPLSQPEAECLLLSVRLELGVPDAEKQKLLGQVRAKAEHFRGDAHVQVMLADAEVQYGDRARGLELLQAQLASTPNDRHALLDLGELELDTERADEDSYLAAYRRARELAVKANRLAPNDPEALFLFYRSFAHEAKGPSRNAIDALDEAYRNLPQYQEIALAEARQYLRDGKPDYAIAVLKPIAYSPHGEKNAQKMRTWIQEIEAKTQPSLVDATAQDAPDTPK
jgi:hypothetical protein